MKSVYRNVCCALLLVVAALVSPCALAGDAGTPMTLAMAPAPLGGQVFAPPVAEPVLLCSNRWVNGDYVLPNNCKKACINKGHSPADCQNKRIPLCLSCWKQLQVCANKPAPPGSGVKCVACSEQYAECMATFLK